MYSVNYKVTAGNRRDHLSTDKKDVCSLTVSEITAEMNILYVRFSFEF